MASAGHVSRGGADRPVRLAARLRSRLSAVCPWLDEEPPPPDPFEALRVQVRLAAVASEVHELERADVVYAKAHRLYAVRAAYDDLLEEACRLAGVPLEPDARRDAGERLREEVELASRGWSW